MTLTEFLLARIAEDEESSRTPEEWEGIPELARIWTETQWFQTAERLAKRRIVETYRERGAEFDERYPLDPYIWHIFKCLAEPYAYHPDYREEWRP